MMYAIYAFLGFTIGMVLSDFSAKARYQQLLKLCAKSKTPEKFIDGSFYYIVPESEMETPNAENKS